MCLWIFCVDLLSGWVMGGCGGGGHVGGLGAAGSLGIFLGRILWVFLGVKGKGRFIS